MKVDSLNKRLENLESESVYRIDTLADFVVDAAKRHRPNYTLSHVEINPRLRQVLADFVVAAQAKHDRARP